MRSLNSRVPRHTSSLRRIPGRKGGGGLATCEVELETRGFTLIELMVVITIIAILLVTVGTVMTNVVERGRYARALSTVQLLDKGCDEYKMDYRTYPPAQPYEGSQNLHYYLGRRRIVVKQFRQDGNHVIQEKPPLLEFKRDMLDASARGTEPDPPAFVIDVWGRRIQYANPGANNKKGVDIWSLGGDEKDPEDDVSNWTRE